ncbi:MAG: hypothetical protein IT207_07315 [Fimbriimonadaceae bacterium]|nr:hypothetical protein [Fimbriimonadaceae bacterium]
MFTTENFVIDGGGDPNDPQALQYFNGVVYDFGVLGARGDYYLADVDLSQTAQYH